MAPGWGETKLLASEASMPPERSYLKSINTRLIEALINSESTTNGAQLVSRL